ALRSHGGPDPTLPLLDGRRLHGLLGEGGRSVDFVEVEGAHATAGDEIERGAALLAGLPWAVGGSALHLGPRRLGAARGSVASGDTDRSGNAAVASLVGGDRRGYAGHRLPP